MAESNPPRYEDLSRVEEGEMGAQPNVVPSRVYTWCLVASTTPTEPARNFVRPFRTERAVRRWGKDVAPLIANWFTSVRSALAAITEKVIAPGKHRGTRGRTGRKVERTKAAAKERAVKVDHGDTLRRFTLIVAMITLTRKLSLLYDSRSHRHGLRTYSGC